MTAHSEYCQCWRCIQEGIEDADVDLAEQRSEDLAAEREERRLAYADGATSNYPEGWGDAPW